jgi:hypothetical protein
MARWLARPYFAWKMRPKKTGYATRDKGNGKRETGSNDDRH